MAATGFVISVAFFFCAKKPLALPCPCTPSHRHVLTTISVFYLIMKLCKWQKSPTCLFNSKKVQAPITIF